MGMARPRQRPKPCGHPTGCDRPAKTTGLCAKHYHAQYCQTEKYKTWAREYQQRPEVKERDRTRAKKEREKRRPRERKYRRSAKGRATHAAYLKSPAGRAMRHRVCVAYNKRRAARLREATPKWLDPALNDEVYARCPTGMWVDHIVPLFGENVCGLHVPWNLRYLSPLANSLKWNKLEEE
jgi:hypothetical protein